MIPIVSIFFTFTNTGESDLAPAKIPDSLQLGIVGAALWAADIEQKNTQMTQGTAPNLRESAKKAE